MTGHSSLCRSVLPRSQLYYLCVLSICYYSGIVTTTSWIAIESTDQTYVG